MFALAQRLELMGQGRKRKNWGLEGVGRKKGDSLEFCSARVKARVANYPQWYLPLKMVGTS